MSLRVGNFSAVFADVPLAWLAIAYAPGADAFLRFGASSSGASWALSPGAIVRCENLQESRGFPQTLLDLVCHSQRLPALGLCAAWPQGRQHLAKWGLNFLFHALRHRV